MATENLDSIGSDIAAGAPLPDSQAKKEQKELFGEDKRAEEKKDAIHVLFLCAIRVITGVVLVLFVVRMMQSVLPECCCWLSTEQKKSIDDFIFHGAIGGILVGSVKQILSSHIPKQDSN